MLEVEREFPSACGWPAQRLPDATGSANCKFGFFCHAIQANDVPKSENARVG
jgi:hypothetical protein